MHQCRGMGNRKSKPKGVGRCFAQHHNLRLTDWLHVHNACVGVDASSAPFAKRAYGRVDLDRVSTYAYSHCEAKLSPYALRQRLGEGAPDEASGATQLIEATGLLNHLLFETAQEGIYARSALSSRQVPLRRCGQHGT